MLHFSPVKSNTHISRFQILQILAKMNQCQLFCEFHIAPRSNILLRDCIHAKGNKKSMLACFYAPNKPANQNVNFDVIGNVMTFLTLRFVTV